MARASVETILARNQDYWDMAPVAGPLVAFTLGGWSNFRDNPAADPLWGDGELTPEMIDVPAFVPGQRRVFESQAQVDDDVCRAAMPFASIPWIEAALGCPVLRSATSFWTKPILDSPAAGLGLRLDPQNPWVRKYIEFLDVYHEAFGEAHPVGQSVLRGPSDLAAALMGEQQSVFALMQQPEEMAALLEHLAAIIEQFIALQLEHIPLYHGGQVVGQYEIWAPGTFVRLQEDAIALYSPPLYRSFLLEIDRRMARHAPYNLLHLHTTSLHLIDPLLEIDGVGVYQVSKDEGSAGLEPMMAALEKVQAAGRRLVVKGRFDDADLDLLRTRLKIEGLCLQPVVQTTEEAQTMIPKLRNWR